MALVSAAKNIVKAGLVHEYTNYDCVAHCDAHITCLEQVSPDAGARMRAKANDVMAKFGSIRSITNELQRDCSTLLDKAAPSGLYFGAPSCHSNMAGYWPVEWIEGATNRNPKGVPDSVARTLGEVAFC
jgi:hypothetical protein